MKLGSKSEKNKKQEQVEQEDFLFQDAPKIRGRIIDSNKGMRFLPEVTAVRIRSDQYGLLIMEDYMPTLGRIAGSIVFLTPEGEVRYDEIEGFYKHQYNEFTLLIQNHKQQPVAEETVKAKQQAPEPVDQSQKEQAPQEATV